MQQLLSNNNDVDSNNDNSNNNNNNNNNSDNSMNNIQEPATTEPPIDHEFIQKCMSKAAKYRSNTKTEINKQERAREELSVFLNYKNDDEVLKTILNYKEEMKKDEMNDDSVVDIDLNKMNIPSPPSEK
jgi:hypothetical protein